MSPSGWLRSIAKPTLSDGRVSLGPLTEERLCELLEGWAAYKTAYSPSGPQVEAEELAAILDEVEENLRISWIESKDGDRKFQLLRSALAQSGRQEQEREIINPQHFLDEWFKTHVLPKTQCTMTWLLSILEAYAEASRK